MALEIEQMPASCDPGRANDQLSSWFFPALRVWDREVTQDYVSIYALQDGTFFLVRERAMAGWDVGERGRPGHGPLGSRRARDMLEALSIAQEWVQWRPTVVRKEV